MPAATQADFDEAVRVNMVDFDMGGPEAVAAAVEELELQGLDLTGIVKAVPGTAPPHPASIAAAELVRLVADTEERADAAAVDAAVAALAVAVQDADGGTIAARAGAVPALLSASTTPALATLATLLALTPGTEARDAAVTGGGVDAALSGLRASGPPTPAWTASARLAAALATKHEGAKAALVAGGLGAIVAGCLASATDEGAAAAAGVVAACCTADDARPATSAAFQHGRALGAGGGLPTALLAAVADPARSLDAAAAAARAARRVLVNDDLVRAAAGLAAWPQAGDDGASDRRRQAPAPPAASDGVAAALAALRRGAADPSPSGARLARAAAGLARQLAGSDPVKPVLVAGGALDAVAALAPAAAAAGGHATVEQALGLVAALTLRNPAGAEAAVAAGCVPAIAAVLAGPAAVAAKAGGGGGGEVEEEEDGENEWPALPSTTATTPATPTPAAKTHQWAQRQACAAARNLAARASPDGPVLAALQAARLAPLLRAARRRYPAACGDVGAAALRDLGVEDYNAA